MHKKLLVLFYGFLFLFSSSVFAQCCGVGSPYCVKTCVGNTWVEFDLDAGYRQDRFKWHETTRNPTRCDDHLPIRDVEWKQLQSWQIMSNLRIINCHHIYFRGTVDYAQITKGHTEDREFFLDGSTLEKADGRCNDGYLYDLTGGIGYYFSFLCDRVGIAPVGGYSYHAQRLKMDSLFVSVDPINNFVGPLPSGFTNKYRARWFGGWLGADLFFKMTSCLSLYLSGEAHWVYYRANATWVLPNNILFDPFDPFNRHFTQRATGWGQVYTWGLNYNFARHWTASLMGNYQAWKTRSGLSRLHFPIDQSIRHRFGGAHWHSVSVMGALAVHY